MSDNQNISESCSGGEFEKELKALCDRFGADLYCDWFSDQDCFAQWEIKLSWNPPT